VTTQTWITGTSGDWSTVAGWVSGTVPSATDDAVINNTNTVTVNGTAVANSLTLDNSEVTISGTLTLGTSLTLDGGTDQFLLNGGTLAAQSITSNGLSEFIGFGTISVTGTVAGFVYIDAAGGTLKVDGPLAGQVYYAGNELSYFISLGATLELSSGTASAVSFTQNSFVNGIYQEHPDTLKLDIPAAFTGPISNISVGDMIDLVGITANSATISGSGLTINETNGQQLTYNYNGHSAFNASIAGDSLLVASDGNGGTLVYVAAPPATEATTIQQEIAGLYAAVYNRAADSFGMQYWVNVVAQQADALGITYSAAANTPISTNDAALLGQLFVATQSAYFNQTYGNLTDTNFVNALYFNIGGQNAEAASAIAYWVNIIQAGEASGLSVQNARAAMVGQFVHDLIDVNLAQSTSVLTPSELETTILRQAVVDNKLAVSLAYVNASANPNGSFLNTHVVGDAAFQAQVTALTGMVINPLGASVEVTAINQAVSHHNLADIQPVGILMPHPVA
jgi:hypothetical protein